MGKIISMHRGTSRVRKRDTGVAGNRGEFAAVTRTEAEVEVLEETRPVVREGPAPSASHHGPAGWLNLVTAGLLAHEM